MAAKKAFHDPTQQAEGRAARWKNEPLSERHPSLRVHTKRPFNAEPSNFALQAMYTPKGQHYRRTHAPVPLVDESQYRLSVSVESKLAKQFSMHDLRNKVAKEIAVTLMCTGNRRGEYNEFGSTAGLPWKNGSISTAKWKGCLLREVLNDAGIFYEQAKQSGYQFVTFWGLEDYHISIPLKKAMDADGDCLLCYGMNGEAVPRDHGAPVRAIIPGFVGARSVKWLDKIVLSKREVDGLHQTGIAYKQLGPNFRSLKGIPKSMIAELPPIDIIPVTSAVTAPDAESSVLRGQQFEVKGYAYSGGGRAIARVDVSMDNGKSWDQAKLSRAVNGHSEVQDIRSYKAWAWSQWRYTARIPQGAKEVCICCKAVDDQYNQQPHTVEPIWNVRGVLNTAWGRVVVKTNGPRL